MTKKGLKDIEFNDFLVWEMYAEDTIDFKRAYIDMAGDLIAGLLLSQIVYWHLPNKQDKCKLRVWKEGLLWLAKAHNDWYDEIRITAKQAARALDILVKRGLIIKRRFRFSGSPTTHVRIDPEGFMQAWHEIIENPNLPKGKIGTSPEVVVENYQKVETITETTSKNTTEKPVLSSSKTTPEPTPVSEQEPATDYLDLVLKTRTAQDKLKYPIEHLAGVAADLLGLRKIPDHKYEANWESPLLDLLNQADQNVDKAETALRAAHAEGQGSGMTMTTAGSLHGLALKALSSNNECQGDAEKLAKEERAQITMRKLAREKGHV